MRCLQVFAPAFAAVLVCAPGAVAQVVPDIGDAVVQGEIINRNVDETTRAVSRGRAEAEEIDGEAGIYVLTLNEIFSVFGEGGIGYASNPTRSANDPGGSWYVDAGLGVGLATQLGQKIDFGASASVTSREFLDDDADAASSQSLSGSVAVGAPIGRFYLGLVGFGGWSFQDNIDDRIGFYGLSANVSTTIRLSERAALRPGLGLTRQWSETEENNNLTAIASADLIYAFTPDLIATGRVAVFERVYDDFYEDVTFIEREDTNAGGSIALVYRMTPALRIGAGASFERQDSTFFLSEFDAYETAITATLRLTF